MKVLFSKRARALCRDPKALEALHKFMWTGKAEPIEFTDHDGRRVRVIPEVVPRPFDPQ